MSLVIWRLVSLACPELVGKSASPTQPIATRMVSTSLVHLTTANVEEFAGKHRNAIPRTFLSVLLYNIHTNMAHATNLLTSNAVQDRFTVERGVP